MHCYTSSLFIICTVIAAWSILQTILHLTWIVYGQYLYTCQYKPNNIFLYLVDLTYFRKTNCDLENATYLIDTEIFCDDFTRYLFENISNDDSICNLAKDLNERGIFTDSSMDAAKTIHVFDAMLIFDCILIVSSVALLVGTCVKIKEAWAILFYVPWIIGTSITCLIDLILTCIYATDAINTKVLTNWLKFIGVVNYMDFESYNTEIVWGFSSLASVIMCFLSCRLVLFTILNIISLVFVLRITILAYKLSYMDERAFRRRKRKPITFNDTQPSNEMNLDVTAARIKNWQLFYGNTEPNSRGSSTRSQYGNRDQNSNREDDFTKGHERNEDISSIVGSNDGNDMPTNHDHSTKQKTMEELRGQLPWSYMPPTDEKITIQSILRKSSEYSNSYPRHSSSSSIAASQL